MKKLLAMLLALIMVLALVACGGGAADGGAEDSGAADSGDAGADDAADSIKVALILPGQSTDMGWSTQGYNGLMRAQEELGVEVAYAEKISESDAEEYIRGYANDGYDLVVAHSSAYADAMKAVAANFPDTWFVVTSTNAHEGDNMSAYSNDNAEQGNDRNGCKRGFCINGKTAVGSDSGFTVGMDVDGLSKSDFNLPLMKKHSCNVFHFVTEGVVVYDNLHKFPLSVLQKVRVITFFLF